MPTFFMFRRITIIASLSQVMGSGHRGITIHEDRAINQLVRLVEHGENKPKLQELINNVIFSETALMVEVRVRGQLYTLAELLNSQELVLNKSLKSRIEDKLSELLEIQRKEKQSRCKCLRRWKSANIKSCPPRQFSGSSDSRTSDQVSPF